MRSNNQGSNGLQINKASADIDYKRAKVEVYVQEDIFNQCANPFDYEEIKEMSTKDIEDDITLRES